MRDPAQEFRSFVRVRNGETGEIKFDLADHWAAAALRSDLPNSSTLLLAYAAPQGTTPTQGDLEAFVTTGSWPARKVASLTNASFLQPEVGRPQNDTFYVRETDATGNAAVRRYHWTASGIAFEQEMTGEQFRSCSLRAISAQFKWLGSIRSGLE